VKKFVVFNLFLIAAGFTILKYLADSEGFATPAGDKRHDL